MQQSLAPSAAVATATAAPGSSRQTRNRSQERPATAAALLNLIRSRSEQLCRYSRYVPVPASAASVLTTSIPTFGLSNTYPIHDIRATAGLSISSSRAVDTPTTLVSASATQCLPFTRPSHSQENASVAIFFI